MSLRLASIAVALLFFGLGAAQIILARKLPGGGLAEPGPNLFPTVVGGLMMVASAIYLAQELLQRSDGSLDVRSHAPRVAGIALATALFAILLPRLGFAPAAFLLQLAMLRLFGLKRWAVAVALSAAMTLVAYVVFESLLGVRFPSAQWIG